MGLSDEKFNGNYDEVGRKYKGRQTDSLTSSWCRRKCGEEVNAECLARDNE